MKKFLIVAAAVLFSVAGVTGTALAQYQDQSAQDQNQDNSQVQPAVGRLSMIHGDVSVQRGDSGDWIAATLNTPLEAGDRVSTGNGGRAEVQLDYANVIRLDENSTVKITDLTKTHIQVQIGQGLVEYSVFKNSQTDAEIDTPNSAVHPLRDGDYRIQVNGDSDSQVIVRGGQAEVSEPQGSTRIESGQLIEVQGTDNPQYQTMNAPRKDDFDKWNESRNSTILDAQSWQHTDRYYTGTQDLDAYGHWENVPDYGQVWVPEQNSGWAPYRDGQWVWEPYYGWTWQSYEPWGWAPYHYGRWFVSGGNWAWWPGPVGVYGGWGGYYPVWSPAYVSFFGWGDDVGFGFGFGNVGWLPIGPADPFCPWWGSGVNRVSVVNVTNITNVSNITNINNFNRLPVPPLFNGRAGRGFSNITRVENDARIRSGISSVRGDEFGRGGGASKFQRGIGTGQFRQASLMTGRLPVAPTRESLGRLERNVSPTIARTGSISNQRFFSQSKPSFTPRPFSEQAAQTQRMIANSRTQAGTMNNRGNNGVNGSKLPSAPAMQQHNTDAQSMRSFPSNNSRSTGTSATQNGRFNNPSQQSGVRPTWHSFGQGGGTSTPSPTQNHGSVQGQTQDRGSGSTQRPVVPVQQRPNTSSPPSAPTSQRPGWRSFTPSNGNDRNNGYRQPQAPARMNQGGPSRSFQPAGQPSQPSRRFEQQSPTSQPGQGGYRQFTPPSQQQSRPAPRVNTPTRPGYQNFPPRSSQPHSDWSSSGRSNNSSSYRPSLDMRQPVVSQRAPSNYGVAPQRGYSGGGSPYSRPDSGYSHRTYSGGGGAQQRYGGGNPYGGRPTSTYSPRSYGGGGGSYGRPSGGGSPSYSRPSGGGSYSRPSGGSGGGRPSGGGGSRSSGSHPSGGGRPHR
ncbi:MAG TPA: DUF6600 domain-containing protein [Candidatus Acidoferrales bacterium]|nr:DUF6600 domain-containing protein [Candidatus Acidoferrales bacterium]